MDGKISKEKQQQMQQRYFEMQKINQQIQKLEKQAEMIENQINELNITNNALSEIKNTKEGKDIKAPLASGIFIEAKITNNKEVLVNTGAGTTVRKTIPAAKKLIENQLKEIKKFKDESSSNLEKLNSRARELEEGISELVK